MISSLPAGSQESLTLRAAKLTSSGDSKSSDESSFYGLNAGVLATSRGHVTITGGSVSTTGAGANGVFAYGAGASVTMRDATIRATGRYAHGAMTSGGGSVTLSHVTISTAGASSAPVATDRGGGTVSVSGGTLASSGSRSPGIYSTGNITVTGARVRATGAEGAVVEGANTIRVRNTVITAAKDRGVMLCQSMSGDAQSGHGTYIMDGGSLSAAQGPAFYVTNTKAAITLRGGARVSARSGTLLLADSNGTGSGNAGAGVVTFRAYDETLRGDLVAKGTSSIAATLTHRTTLTGTISGSALRLDATSFWRVTGDSSLTALGGATISGGRITNITGNGHTVTYRSSASPALGGKTYGLAGGGTLKPAG